MGICLKSWELLLELLNATHLSTCIYLYIYLVTLTACNMLYLCCIVLPNSTKPNQSVATDSTITENKNKHTSIYFQSSLPIICDKDDIFVAISMINSELHT